MELFKNHLNKNKLSTKIIVDGGMNLEHIKLAKSAGVDIFISGSYIIKAKNPRKAMAELKKSIK